MTAKRYRAEVVINQEEAEVIPFKYAITSYGADFPVDALVKRVNKEDIFIPEFQRGYVWKLREASRFVESLLLGLPVPAIFLSKERVSKKLLVIDGRQRLTTLQLFYANKIALKEVQPQYEGITYDKLEDEDRRQLDDALVHAVIVQQEQPSNDDSSIYHIFERLNTGGVHLEPQEIRACIYHGALNQLLKELNANEHWRKLYGPENRRMRDRELILRFFAFYYDHAQYAKPVSMKEFLNNFMGSNRDLSRFPQEELIALFASAVETIHSCLGRKAFRPKRLNAAVAEAIMVGMAKRLERGPLTDPSSVQDRYKTLLADEEFQAATETGTAHQESVKKRITLAISAFSDVT